MFCKNCGEQDDKFIAELYLILNGLGIKERDVKRIARVADWQQGARYRVFTKKYKKIGMLVYLSGNIIDTIWDENRQRLYRRES